jgi:hypothetical protein
MVCGRCSTRVSAESLGRAEPEQEEAGYENGRRINDGTAHGCRLVHPGGMGRRAQGGFRPGGL